MRVLICGDRGWTDYSLILSVLSAIHTATPVEVVIEGEANGADKLGRRAAEQLGIPVLPFPADWKQFGRAAGPIRNRQQHREGKPTLVLAFHSDLANSKGTKDMVEVARAAGTEVRIFTGEDK